MAESHGILPGNEWTIMTVSVEVEIGDFSGFLVQIKTE
jgi:hypothetical protein